MKIHTLITRYELEMPPELIAFGYPRAYEIPIEDCGILPECGITAPPWCIDIIADRESAWSDRVNIVESDEIAFIRSLSEQLKRFAVHSIVVSGSDVYCKCVCGSPAEPQNSFFLIRERRSFSDVLVALPRREQSFFRDACVLSGFLFGFREDFPPSGGHWVDLANEQSLFTDEYVSGNFGCFELTSRWNPALKVFSARNGDALVINRVGEWGWWLAGSEDEIDCAGRGMCSLATAIGDYCAELGSSAGRALKTAGRAYFDSKWGDNV